MPFVTKMLRARTARTVSAKECSPMDRDVVEGKAKQVQGRVQDAVGDLTDSPKDDAKGKARVAEGKVQEGFGRVKEAVRGAAEALDEDDHV